MRFSWNWIADFVDLSGISPEAVASRFTMTVAELEGLERIGEGLDAVLVGRLLGIEPHPNAERLHVIHVDVGGRVVRGVSGAPNLSPGLVMPVALPGCRLPSGDVVEGAQIRGIKSEVLVLSERDMGLSDDHSGVLELPADSPVGVPFPVAFPVQDFVFVVDNKSITHRPDLWGHYGVARELAAMFDRPMRDLDDQIPIGEGDPLKVSVEDFRDCPRYMAMCFDHVRVAPSPFWIRHRLRAVGLRPISNLVDLTNYVMMALGEPTHAFDRRQIGNDEICVRRARPGERMRTLDGNDHELTPDDLLIADAKRPIALAGVMGGENSEILPDTTAMVLECACFHPALIRRTAVRHGMRTDASARFEKSLDPNLPEKALAMFARMLREVCPDSTPASRVYDVGSFDRKSPRIILDPAYVSRRLGIDVPATRTRQILVSLGFGVTDRPDGRFDVAVPSWRATRDISIPEDLVEEVGRVHGYDRISPEAPLVRASLVSRVPLRDLASRVRRILSLACGLDEVRTYSFSSNSLLARIGHEPGPVQVRNPISADMTHLRTDLVAGLLGAMEQNATRFDEFGIYEIGRVFLAGHDGDGVPVQPTRLAVLLYDRKARGADGVEALFRRLKGNLYYLMDRLERGAPALEEEAAQAGPVWLMPNSCVAVLLSGIRVGYCTRVHPAVMHALDVPGIAVAAELDLASVLGAPECPRLFAAVPRFPAIQADISLVVDRSVKAADIERLIRANGTQLLTKVEFIAVYAGPPIPEGRRSLSFRMTFQAPDRTLSDAEVKAAVDRVLLAARAEGASLRQ